MKYAIRSYGIAALLFLLLGIPGRGVSAPAVLFNDNFNTGTLNPAWVSKMCCQTVQNGKLYSQDTDGWPRDALTIVHDSDPTWADYTVSLTAAFANGTPWEYFNIVLRADGYERSSAVHQGTGYELEFFGAGGWAVPDGKRIVLTRTDWNTSSLVTLYDRPWNPPSGPMTLTISLVGGRIQLRLNNQPIFDVADPHPLPFGGVGLHTVWESVASFDNVVVTAGASDTTGPSFFSDTGYQGNTITLPAGSYTQSALAAKGVANNAVSSIRVPAGFKVEAFDSGDLTGTPLTISGDTPSLAVRAFDNRISSVRISKITIGAIFYQLCGKNGYNATLPPGNYTKASLAKWGIADDDISGLLPASGMEVELFKNDLFGGDSVLHRAANYCLSWADNSTSSIRIRSSAIRFSDNFNAGITNWAPETGTWRAVNGTMVGTGYNATTHTKTSFDGSVVVDVDVNMIHESATVLLNSTGRKINEYEIHFWNSNSIGYANRYQIRRCDDGWVTCVTISSGDDVIDGNVRSPFPIPSKCRLTVRRLGDTFDLYVNGRRIARHTDPTPTPADGRVGLFVIWDYTAAFDNFTVRR